MTKTEIPEYVNEKPRPEQKHHSNTVHFSKSSAYLGCNITHCDDGNQTVMNECSGLNRNRECFENMITELTNMIHMTENERERLKIHLRDLAACAPALRCPAGWRKIESRCYFLSVESNTWEESRRYCQRQGADLVVINSEREQTYLYRLNGEDVLLFWIGLRKGGRLFEWVDGSALTKEYWQDGEPNLADNEDCVESYHLRPVLSNWNDAPCSKRQRWLCEKDPF
ncbi:CD209 antigen-like protein C isoform X2 [Betta splendens]|uniref:CD209 antigen-like protein C isoform X2 n=1 Tax=Betta splendens TaxID=158456 RepID=A0A9W2XUZ3_BETSP|nr:CD209 antigen-like protein C isoform X2 [Betta splendens]